MNPSAWPDPALERRSLLGLALLMLVAAWCSIGFHHNDEHFQVLEFATQKLGFTPAADLPWEYHNRIRSWFQPAIALLTLKGLRLVGDRDPFHAAFLLRLFSGALYGAALLRLFRCSRHWCRSAVAGRVALVAACGLWFVPFIAVRFSAENWSGSLFFLGFVSLVLQAETGRVSARELWLAGLAMGLAIAARFQAGLLVMPALAWFVWKGRPRPSDLVAVLSGISLALGASLLLDRWGYGQWGLTPWRYLDLQLLQGVAEKRFGAFPWWWYVPKILVSAGPPIGLPLLAGVILGWIKRPSSGLTWVSLTFFISHCLLAHKELRFLFPLSLGVAFLVAFALEAYPRVTRWAFHTRSGRVVCGVLIVLNALGFLVRMALPARQEIGLQRAIYYSLPKRLLIVRGNDPYLIGGRRSHFYRDPALEIGNLTDVGGGMVRDIIREPALIALPTGTPVDTVRLRCQTLYQTFPDWVLQSPIWPRLAWAEPKPWTLRRCVAR